MNEVLNIQDAMALAAIIDAAQRGAKVARVIPPFADPVYGTARSIGKGGPGFGFLRPDEDVRDAYLRVTSVQGLEHAWPVSELVTDHQGGLFVVDVTL